jgi:hypothetical protein
MKNTLIALGASVFLFSGFSAQAAEFDYARPRGDYFYKDSFNVTLVRRAEQVPYGTPDGERRRGELRRSGFSCLRKNQKFYLCTRNEPPQAVSPAVAAAIHNRFEGLKISFGEPVSKPEPVLDTSMTQEWMIRDPVVLDGIKVGLFKFVYLYEEKIVRLVFPVSDEQPIPYVRMDSPDLLALTFTMSEKQGAQTVGYVIDAELER